MTERKKAIKDTNRVTESCEKGEKSTDEKERNLQKYIQVFSKHFMKEIPIHQLRTIFQFFPGFFLQRDVDPELSKRKIIISTKVLKILLSLRENFIDGMNWSALRELTNLSSSSLKRHIDVLTDVGLIGKSNNHHRITQSGLGLLTQIDQVIEDERDIKNRTP